MNRVTAAIMSRAGGYLALLGVILVLLIVAGPLKTFLTDGWKSRKEAQQDIVALERKLESLESQEDDVVNEIESAEADWRIQQESDAAPYRTRLREIDAQLEQVGAEWLELEREYFDLASSAKSLRHEANVAKVALDEIENESRFYDVYLNQERYAALVAARIEFAARDLAADGAELARGAKLRAIESSRYDAIAVEKRKVQEMIDRFVESTSPALSPLLSELDSIQQSIANSKEDLKDKKVRFEQTRLQRLASEISAKLPLALSILVGIALAPLAIKTIFYFGLAPLASRLPPIQIISDPSMPEIPEFTGSTVSLDVQLSPAEELLVRPDFFQSSSLASQKRTEWLLNARLPLSSLASGMYALTRIRPEDAEGSRAVVSSRKDLFAKVGIVEIPNGAAMVVQPRALAGVVKIQELPVQITRHWRLNSAHAWLTLQLRYLVFHGPCRLILQGCRGVKVESPDSRQARAINQAATLCFSANLGYKTVRTETFFPYLQGDEGLFNDLFFGDSGRFIYEEHPHGGREPGVVGRGLEGLADAILKAFGI